MTLPKFNMEPSKIGGFQKATKPIPFGAIFQVNYVKLGGFNPQMMGT